jgi:hypothetical protein
MWSKIGMTFSQASAKATVDSGVLGSREVNAFVRPGKNPAPSSCVE